MDNDKPVKLKLTGATLSYETEISDILAVQIMSLCISGSVVQSPSASHRASGDSSIKESVAEYITRVGAKRNPDKILAFAAYLADQQQKQSVSPEELKLQFREAGEVPPANFSRDFSDTTASGWLASEPQKKGYYYVTRTGHAVIEKGFEKVPVKRQKKSSSGKKADSLEAESV